MTFSQRNDVTTRPWVTDSESPESQPAAGPSSSNRPETAWFAAIIALFGWTALAIDFPRAVARSLDQKHGLADAMFSYVRYFTIETNFWVAVLMAITALAIARRTRLPSPGLHRAAVVYMAVTCITYELLLRRLWSPRGVQFATDFTFHDIQPALTLLFWLVCAPKRNLRWRTIPWVLAFPAAYFVIVLAAGALGAGYPYGFIDAGRIGYPAVIVTAVVFLAIFLALAALMTAVARVLTGGR